MCVCIWKKKKHINVGGGRRKINNELTLGGTLTCSMDIQGPIKPRRFLRKQMHTHSHAHTQTFAGFLPVHASVLPSFASLPCSSSPSTTNPGERCQGWDAWTEESTHYIFVPGDILGPVKHHLEIVSFTYVAGAASADADILTDCSVSLWHLRARFHWCLVCPHVS